MNRILCYEDLTVCDCAACGRTCLGENCQAGLAAVPKYAWPPRARTMPVVAGRVLDRPYCNFCYEAVRVRAHLQCR